MQKIKSKEQLKQELLKHKEDMKKLVHDTKVNNKKRKIKHKEIVLNIKNDKKNQKNIKKEIQKFKTKDKPFRIERIKAVKEWYKNEDKNSKEIQKLYKYKMNNAKKLNYDFSGDIKFENISYTYGIGTPFEFVALDKINLTIKKNIITAVIGMTGSGKSTLIQLTNGLLVTETGRTMIGNYSIPASTKKIKEVKDLRREIGLVFQFPEYQLFQDTIEKDIAFGPINLGGLKSEAISNVPKLLELVGLPADYAKRSPFDLSGGQKRRVAIAGIIAMNGNTLVLDEPTGGLDPQGEDDFISLFNNLNKKEGKRVILVTHNMDHVLKIADEVIVMEKGKVSKVDTPHKIFSDEALLKQLDIEPPKLYKLAFALKKQGIDVIGEKFRDTEELAQAIKKVKTKKK